MKNGINKVSHPFALNLFFTGKCNLNCHYCFVDKSGQGNSTLDEKSLKKSVDLLFSYPGRRKSISFVGGEPMMEFLLVKRISGYALKLAKKKKIILDIIVSTNGTLLSQKAVDYFIKNKIILKISIDGGRKTQNKNRPFKVLAKRSSFGAVMENLDKIKFKNLKITASLVFTPGNIDDLIDNIKFLNSKNFHCIDFYPGYYATWQKKDLLKLKEVFSQFEVYYKNLFKSNKKVFKNFQIGAIFNKLEFSRRDNCGKINVGADGYFYACDKVFSLPDKQKKKYIVGNTETGLDNKKRNRLMKKLNKDFFKKNGLGCANCIFLNYCFCLLGHFIYFSNFKNAGLDKYIWKNLCFISKLYIKTVLELKKSLQNELRFISLYRS